jgi:hypothetical protein
MIFLISEALDKAEKILPATFIGLKIWERQHIEEWIRGNPEILGEDLLILTIEFDRFVASSDRLDVLALDRDGNLVVVELKRDSAAGFADLQAIRYAAMVSSMTIDKVVPYYIAYRKKHYNEQITVSEARDQVVEFVESDSFAELSTRPRIILCSEGFSQEITTTVLWLKASQIDITCIQITPYKVGDQLIIVPKVIIPLEEAKQYLIDIKVKEEEREQSSRRPKTMRILIDNGLVKAGDEVYLKNGLPSYVHFEDDNPVFQAIITGKLGQSDAVRWKQDNAEYSISALAWKIFKDQHPEHKDPGGVNGNWHWVNSGGHSLWEVAEDFLKEKVEP